MAQCVQGAPVEDAVRVAPRQPSQHLVRERLPGARHRERVNRSEGAAVAPAAGAQAVGKGEQPTLMQFALSLYWHDFMYFLRS